MKTLHLLLAMMFILTACNRNTDKQGTQQGGMNHASHNKDSHCKPKTSDLDWYSSGTKAPKFEGLGDIQFKISTNNAEAQQYFNQGMELAYGFNHAEAARSFYEATRLDSNCAMCYWGYAYVLGPNYNGGMEPGNFERAYTASRKAARLSSGTSAVEKALIDALQSRYAANPPEIRTELDIAYNAAMKKVYAQFPDHPDVGALYAESMMDLHPWDLYEKKSKSPKPWTPELISVLEHLIKKNPKHPGAHHFYIHAVEASAKPERGIESAKVLPLLAPKAGHLVHMPSHIYINTGDYYLGSLANIDAVNADSTYFTACHAQGAYPLAYYPHNYHFLAATATLQGDASLAWMAAMKVQENTAEDIMSEPGWATLQHYYTIPWYVAVKFGMWDSILAVPLPADSLVYPKAILHYARGMAFLGLNDVNAAQKELTSLNVALEDSSLKTLTIWGINTTYDLVQIAMHVLKAGISAEMKQTEQCIALLKKAVEMEDALNYDEPPDWFFSVRHYLGVELIKAGKYSEADKVYLDDLKTWKKNGWALIGLHEALLKQGKKVEASKVKLQFDEAWKHADFMITSSAIW